MTRLALQDLSPKHQAEALACLHGGKLVAGQVLPDPYALPHDPYSVAQRGKEGAGKRQSADNQQSESRIQQAVIAWWMSEAPLRSLPECLLMAFPLQGRRSKKNGARMKAEGMRAGTPDLFLAVARKAYHGLWIEMKRAGGRLTDTQCVMIGALSGQGYAAFACYSYEQAVKLVSGYLDEEEFF